MKHEFLIILLYLYVAFSENNITESNSNKTKELGYEEDVSKNYLNNEIQEVWRKYLIESEEYMRAKTKTTTNRPVTLPMSSSTGSSSNIILKDLPSIKRSTKLVNVTKTYLSKHANSSKMQENKLIRGNNNTLNIARRAPAPGDDEEDAITARYERFREPYWEDGHWVFERTPSTSAGATARVNFATTDPRDCDPFCSHYFKKYGTICCHRYTVIERTNEYMTFSNMCEMYKYNCMQYTKRPQWHPIHKGMCFKLESMHSGNVNNVVLRKRQYDRTQDIS